MSEEFKNRLLVHAKTAVERAGRAQNEEATKQFLIIPFLQLLGYDPLDPDDVIPEADASFSDKFKNRVDYAICKESVPVIAVEAKKVGSLSDANRGELKGYYNAVPTVKLGILTDGLIYQLFSDTEEENLMDNEPFAVVDLAGVAQEQIADDAFDALLKLRREAFNPEDIGADARRKIFISAYVDTLDEAFKEPDERFVRTLMDMAGIEGRRMPRLLEEHTQYIREAMNTFFDKKLLERVGFADRSDIVKVPPSEGPAPTSGAGAPTRPGRCSGHRDHRGRDGSVRVRQAQAALPHRPRRGPVPQARSHLLQGLQGHLRDLLQAGSQGQARKLPRGLGAKVPIRFPRLRRDHDNRHPIRHRREAACHLHEAGRGTGLSRANGHRSGMV